MRNWLRYNAATCAELLIAFEARGIVLKICFIIDDLYDIVFFRELDGGTIPHVLWKSVLLLRETLNI